MDTGGPPRRDNDYIDMGMGFLIVMIEKSQTSQTRKRENTP